MRILTFFAVLAFALSGCSTSTSDLMGQELYDRSCATCHGLQGEGGIGDAIDKGSNTDLNLTDEQIADVIIVGPGNMPGFSQLTPAQVQSLVDYVRDLSR